MLAAENLFLRKQLALFQERKVKPRRHRRHVLDDGGLKPSIPVARCPSERQSEHVHRLASQRVPALLALEVETDGTAAPDQATERIDPRDGRRESDLG
jgi:hypothetical protein